MARLRFHFRRRAAHLRPRRWCRGSGFAANTAIDIYFDITDEALASTNSSGAFSKIAIQVPASALPGQHWALEWSLDSYSTLQVVPALAGELVYFSCEGNNMCADNATTGADAWFYSLSDVSGVFSSAAVSNGVVYAGASDGNVYALNALNGRVMWSYYTGSYYLGSPAVANGIVYVNSFNNTVYALNATTGNLLWTYTTGSYIYSSPAVANGVVYISSNDDNVYALDAVYGNLLWSYATGGAVESSPAVANGVVYVGSDDNNVYAFGQANPPKSGQLSRPPSLKTLHANLNLKPSQPATNLPVGDNN